MGWEVSDSVPYCPPGTFRYTIRPGDNFWRLAQRFGTTPGAIARANAWAQPWNLIPGRALCIPGAPGAVRPTCPPGWETYVIQPGDTIGDIAYRRGVSAAAILRYNRVNPYNLRPGQRICIPRS